MLCQGFTALYVFCSDIARNATLGRGLSIARDWLHHLLINYLLSVYHLRGPPRGASRLWHGDMCPPGGKAGESDVSGMEHSEFSRTSGRGCFRWNQNKKRGLKGQSWRWEGKRSPLRSLGMVSPDFLSICDASGCWSGLRRQPQHWLVGGSLTWADGATMVLGQPRPRSAPGSRTPAEVRPA